MLALLPPPPSPPHRFADDIKGVSFSLSTDDPGVMQCSITDEYILAKQMGLNEDQLIRSVCGPDA